MAKNYSELEISKNFISELKLRISKCDEINYKDIPCDFIGYDENYWYIFEIKSNFGDCEKAVMQLLRYYDTLRYSKYNRPVEYEEHLKYPDVSIRSKIYTGGQRRLDIKRIRDIDSRKTEKPCGKREIKLFLIYNGFNMVEYLKYYSLYRDYLINPKHPIIEFYYLDENKKPIKL